MSLPELTFPETPARHFALEIVQKLRAAGFIAYWAGGCVRDLLLGKAPKDYDVATSARPDEVQELFGRKKTRAVGAAFGVILVHGSKAAGDIEVATFRSEGPYLDGRRPEHVVFSTPEEDAQRRDFTINGMFYDPVRREVLDYVGGKLDLERQVIRAIGDPPERFREDKLRLLRAIRFTANLRFSLDAETAEAMRLMATEIGVVSPERIAQEWKRMLVHSNRRYALELAAETGLLREVFPEACSLLIDSPEGRLGWQQSLTAVEALVDPSFELALATWLSFASDVDPAAAKRLCQRLRLSNDELDRIVWLIAQQHAIDGARHFSLSKLKRLLAHPGIRDLLALTRAQRQSRRLDLSDLEYCEAYLRQTPHAVIDPPPLITGDDLIRSGLRPGKQFKQLLDALRDAQLECRIQTLDEALAYARQLVAETPQP